MNKRDEKTIGIVAVVALIILGVGAYFVLPQDETDNSSDESIISHENRALEAYNEELSTLNDDKPRRATVLINSAKIQAEKNNYSEAISLTKEALLLDQFDGLTVVNVNINLAEYEAKSGSFDIAISRLEDIKNHRYFDGSDANSKSVLEFIDKALNAYRSGMAEIESDCDGEPC